MYIEKILIGYSLIMEVIASMSYQFSASLTQYNLVVGFGSEIYFMHKYK